MQNIGFLKKKNHQKYFDDFDNIYNVEFYLLLALMYFSIAIVIEGFSLVGAITSIFKPASSAVFYVVIPKTAIFLSPCSKFGKLWKRDLIPW